MFRRNDSKPLAPAQWNYDLQALRERQVSYFLTANPAAKALSPDRSVFHVPIILPDRSAVTLRVTLPPRFPEEPPQLQLLDPVQHPLLDGQGMVVGHRSLMQWNPHCNLGSIVTDIAREFNMRPPKAAAAVPSPVTYPAQSSSQFSSPLTGRSSGSTTPPYGVSSFSSPVGSTLPNYGSSPVPSYQNTSMAQPVAHQTSFSTTQPRARQTHTPQPVIPPSFPDLESKTLAEMQELSTDEEKFESWFNSLPQVQSMTALRDDLKKSNLDLAHSNLARKPELEQLQAELAALHATFTEKRKVFQEKAAIQSTVLQRFSKPAILNMMYEAAGDADTRSDALVQSFLEQQLPHSDFVKQFLEVRQQYHRLNAKRERLEMIR